MVVIGRNAMKDYIISPWWRQKHRLGGDNGDQGLLGIIFHLTVDTLKVIVFLDCYVDKYKR